MQSFFEENSAALLGPSRLWLRAEFLWDEALILKDLYRVEQVVGKLGASLELFDVFEIKHFVAPFSIDVGDNPAFKLGIYCGVVRPKNYLAPALF